MLHLMRVLPFSILFWGGGLCLPLGNLFGSLVSGVLVQVVRRFLRFLSS